MRILHVFRSPVGGLFRHVRDLARGQSSAGHDVAILCSANDGGDAATKLLRDVEEHCALGVHRAPMSRLPGLGDIAGVRAAKTLAKSLSIDVVHCHGAKGGVYGRLAARALGISSVYTPHGGSLHYKWSSPSGAVFLSAEKYLSRISGGFCFVCDFEKQEFARKVGLSGRPSAVVFNGLWPEEFSGITRNTDATDFLFVGEIRHLKGVDILLHALGAIPDATLTVVGDGNEQGSYRQLAERLGLASRVKFAGRLPMVSALSRGKVLVLPSRNESFPYVVIEAAAANTPVIASAVGGIPEIVPDGLLCHDRSPQSLAKLMRAALASDQAFNTAAASLFTKTKSLCDARKMVRHVTDFYTTLKPE